MIEVDLSRCTGCRSCETACSFYHTGKVSRHLARIRVVHIYESGIDGPAVCAQCKERYCLECPVDALQIGAQGQIIASPTICTRCGGCVTRCPIGAIELFDDIIYVCDLCGGNPKCVDACTEGAISYNPSPIDSSSLSSYKEQTKRMNPSEKRHLYVHTHGERVRKSWRSSLD